MSLSRWVGCRVSVYAPGGVGPNLSIAAQGARTAGCRISLTAEAQGFAERRVTAQITVSHNLPNLFYGAVSPATAQISLEDLHGDLKNFLAEEVRGHRVTIRRQDRVLNEVVTVFDGLIDATSVGKEIVLQCVSDDQTVYEAELPKHRIVSHDVRDEDPDEKYTAVDLTPIYPMATDVNLPIPIVMGDAPAVPGLYVYARDDYSESGATDESTDPPDAESVEEGYSSEIIVGDYDYLLCEKSADVPSIAKQLAESWQPGFVVKTRYKYLSATTWQPQSNQLLDTKLDPNDDNVVTGMYAYVTGLPRTNWEADRALIGQFRRIEAYDTATGVVTIESAFDAIPDGSYIELREYAILAGTVYPGRTAIRFHQKQIHEGSLTNITARVVRYRPVIKNLLRWTEQIDNEHWTVATRQSDLSFDFDNAVVEFTAVQSPTGDTSATRVGLRTWSSEFDCAIVMQRIVLPSPTVGSYTFSVWARTETAGQTQFCFAKMDKDPSWDWEAGPSTVEKTLTGEWTRYSQTFTWTPGTAPADIGVGFFLGRYNPLEPATVDIWGAQWEAGTTMTSYEPVAAANQGHCNAIPETLAEIFGDYQIGLGLPIDASSFEAAKEATADLLLRCDGSLPDAASGSGGTALDVINELCMYRGYWWQRQGSAVYLKTDMNLYPHAVPQFGTDETPLRNILEFGSMERPAIADSVKKLRIHYGLGVRPGTVETDYLYRLDYNVNPVGTTKELQLRWVQDHNTADRIGQYLKARYLAANDIRWSITVGQEGRKLQVGDVIEVIAPRLQPENLVCRSEQFSDDVWVKSAALVASTTKLAPHGRAYGGSYTTTSTTLLQVLNTKVLRQWVHVRYYVAKTSEGSPATITTRLYNTVDTELASTTATCYGTEWQEVKQALSVNARSDLLKLELELPADVYIWGVAVTLDYEKPYIRTAATAIVPQKTWQITSFAPDGLSRFKLGLLSFNHDSLIEYTKSTWQNPPAERDKFDGRVNPPPPPTNLTLPPDVTLGDPMRQTAQAGVQVGPDGVVDSWAEIQFLMPVRNCVQCRVQRRVMSAEGWIARWEDIATVTPGDTPLGGPAKVIGHRFVPGLLYEIRVIAFSSNGLSSSTEQDGTHTFVAYGDKVRPNAPVGMEVRQGTGRLIEIEVLSDNVDPKKLTSEIAKVRVYRQETSSTRAAHATYQELDSKRGLLFHDNHVEYGKAYYYWAQMEDWSGNQSDFYPSGAGIGLPTGVLTESDDIIIRAGTIRTEYLFVGDGSNLLANGDFELTDTDAVSWAQLSSGREGWTIQSGSSSPVTARSTRYARRDYDGTAIGYFYSNTFDCRPGQILSGEGWFGHWSGPGYVQPVICWMNSGGFEFSWHAGPMTSLNGKWERKYWQTTEAPAGTRFARLALCVYQHGTGSVSTVDDVRIWRGTATAEIFGTLKVKPGNVDAIQIHETPGNEIAFFDSTGTNKLAIIDCNERTYEGQSLGRGLYIAPGPFQSMSMDLNLIGGGIWRQLYAWFSSRILLISLGTIELLASGMFSIGGDTIHLNGNNLRIGQNLKAAGSSASGADGALIVYDSKGNKRYIPMYTTFS